MPVIIKAVIIILGIMIAFVLKVVKAYFEVKEKEVIQKIGQDKYKSELKMAYDIWKIVEEHFRLKKILENVTTEKIKLFNELLLKKIPYLTQDDIDHLRQVIAGEMNEWKVNLPVSGEGTETDTGPTAADETAPDTIDNPNPTAE
jgi:predicted Holliday junction resolvase-like endonuclease